MKLQIHLCISYCWWRTFKHLGTLEWGYMNQWTPISWNNHLNWWFEISPTKVSQGGFKNVRNSCFGIWDTFFRTCSFCGFPKTATFRIQMTSHVEPLALRTFRLPFFTNSFIQSTTTSDTTASSRKGKNMIHQDALHPQRYQRVLHAPTWVGLFLATILEASLKNRCIYAYEWYNTSLLQAKS